MLTSQAPVHGGVKVVHADVSVHGNVNASASIPKSVYAQTTIGTTVITSRDYEGEYEFTPTREKQEIQVEGLVSKKNIVVNPIPSNYGRIEFDGSSLFVI